MSGKCIVCASSRMLRRKKSCGECVGSGEGCLKRMHQKCEKFGLARRTFECFVKEKLYASPDPSKYAAFAGIIADFKGELGLGHREKFTD
ncbi:hypothetical protein KR51_00028740 [Rubidibacter lacunae KORDI 51-2]|uniref:Uncharacterized protein n=1 Tax=Rubidibacter lacunae KORDI 51-2 TaxID=582515 RepID=U5DI57_9CHRO|nr:hypothetical protein KR51_00028740 [Rubidibacter lacunae KORDI 51-2]